MDIPYGHVKVRCKGCGAEYFVRQKELKKKTSANSGWYPCDRCGSHNTTWEFRKETK